MTLQNSCDNALYLAAFGGRVKVTSDYEFLPKMSERRPTIETVMVDTTSPYTCNNPGALDGCKDDLH